MKEENIRKKFLSLILALAMIFTVASFASAEQGEAVIVGIAGDPGNIDPFQGMGLGRIGILFRNHRTGRRRARRCLFRHLHLQIS